MHTRHELIQHGTKGRQPQRIQNCGKVKIVVFPRCKVGAKHIQHPPVVVEDVRFQVDGLILVVPRTLNLGIPNQVAIHSELVNPKVGQDHRIVF